MSTPAHFDSKIISQTIEAQSFRASPTPTHTRVLFHCRTAHMVVRTQPTLSSGMSARIAEATALSPSSFHKRYRSSYVTSSSSSPPALPIRKREGSKGEGYSSEDEGPGSEDEGHGLANECLGINEEEDEAALEGQQQAILVVDTATDEPQGLGYRALRHCELVLGEGSMPCTFKTPPSPEWSSGSLPVSPSSPVVPSPIASPVTTPKVTISVDEDLFLKRENHGLRMQIDEERRERLELTDRVARMERRLESKGE
nr:hypothetical protein [Tanacetum cinerariifolium]